MSTLIIVYNADSKIFTPKTGKCKLMKLTHSGLFMKKIWKNFLDSLSYHKVFFRKKDFKSAHPELTNVELPVILLKDENETKTLMSSQEINSLNDLDELIGLLGKKLGGF